MSLINLIDDFICVHVKNAPAHKERSHETFSFIVNYYLIHSLRIIINNYFNNIYKEFIKIQLIYFTSIKYVYEKNNKNEPQNPSDTIFFRYAKTTISYWDKFAHFSLQGNQHVMMLMMMVKSFPSMRNPRSSHIKRWPHQHTTLPKHKMVYIMTKLISDD